MSTRGQQKAKYWPTAKAYAALTTNPDGPMNPLVEDGVMPLASLNPVLDKGHEADLFERAILDEGLRQMRSWTPEEIIEVLEDAANILLTLRRPDCDWCAGPILEPVRDPVTVSWLGDGAPTWCSTACMESQSEHAINADAS